LFPLSADELEFAAQEQAQKLFRMASGRRREENATALLYVYIIRHLDVIVKYYRHLKAVIVLK
jgi:hypothetical protein